MIVNLREAKMISFLSLAACDDTDGIIDSIITNSSHILEKSGNFLRQSKEVQSLVDNVRP